MPLEDGIDMVTPVINRAMAQIANLCHTGATPDGTDEGPVPVDPLADIATVLGQAQARHSFNTYVGYGVMRKTHALVQVAMSLLEDPTSRHWGYELSKRSGVRSGVLYPMLTRMLDESWLTDGWEDPTTIRDKRPPRRYYELTSKGRLALGAVLQEARRDARFADLRWQWA